MSVVEYADDREWNDARVGSRIERLAGTAAAHDRVASVQVYPGGAVDACKITLDTGYMSIPEDLARAIYNHQLAIHHFGTRIIGVRGPELREGDHGE